MVKDYLDKVNIKELKRDLAECWVDGNNKIKLKKLKGGFMDNKDIELKMDMLRSFAHYISAMVYCYDIQGLDNEGEEMEEDVKKILEVWHNFLNKQKEL